MNNYVKNNKKYNHHNNISDSDNDSDETLEKTTNIKNVSKNYSREMKDNVKIEFKNSNCHNAVEENPIKNQVYKIENKSCLIQKEEKANIKGEVFIDGHNTVLKKEKRKHRNFDDQENDYKKVIKTLKTSGTVKKEKPVEGEVKNRDKHTLNNIKKELSDYDNTEQREDPILNVVIKHEPQTEDEDEPVPKKSLHKKDKTTKYSENSEGLPISKVKFKQESQSEDELKQPQSKKIKQKKKCITEDCTPQAELLDSSVTVKQEFKTNNEAEHIVQKHKREKKSKKIIDNICENNIKKRKIFDVVDDTDIPDETLVRDSSLHKTKTNFSKILLKKKKIINDPSDAIDLFSHEYSATDEYFFELLCAAEIIVDWEMPKLHKIVPEICRHPEPKVRQKILDANIPQKHGHFTPNEDKIILRNWKRLCVRYNLPDCPEVFARWRNTNNTRMYTKARKKAVLYLSQGLPERTPFQVYQRFLHTLGTTTKGRFLPKEKEIIELFMTSEEYKGISQLLLAGVLGRDPHSIWRYINSIKEKERFKQSAKLKWNLELSETLVLNLLNLMNIKHNLPEDSLDLEVLKNKVDWEIWKVIAKKMNLRPLQVKVHWLSKLYVQLFVQEPIYLSSLRYKLLKVLRTKGYIYWKEVDWKEIATHFENYTTLFLWNKFYSLAKKFLPECSIFNNFSDIIEKLHEILIIKKVNLKNRRLQRLALNNERKLYFINDEEKK